jgi:ribosomal protein L40E
MPSNRPNLTLDAQSFEGLLSAAFTIQEYNDRVNQAQPTQAEPEPNNICPHCGTPKPAEGSRCASCGLDELRPGERLQRNWASMWLMSQEQRLWPERSREIHEGRREEIPPDPKRRPRTQPALDFAASGILAAPAVKEVAQEPIAQEETPDIQHRANGKSALGKSVLAKLTLGESMPSESMPGESLPGESLLGKSVLGKSVPGKLPVKATAEGPWIAESGFPQEDLGPGYLPQEDLAQADPDLAVQPFQLSVNNDLYPSDASISIDEDAPRSLIQRFGAWRVKLHFQRADLYLGVAVFVAALALLWPAADAPQRAALGPWERALVTIGIVEAPAPLVHLHGDPGIAVWVDPHSALYYCPGEEQYGKTADGRFSPQREAQMDRFEPASRTACE